MNTTNYSKIIAKVWSDPQFKTLLLQNPEEALHTLGIEVPEGAKVTICENTENHLYFVVPQKPAGNFSDKELESLAGGAGVPMGDIKLPMDDGTALMKGIKPPLAS